MSTQQQKLRKAIEQQLGYQNFTITYEPIAGKPLDKGGYEEGGWTLEVTDADGQTWQDWLGYSTAEALKAIEAKAHERAN